MALIAYHSLRDLETDTKKRGDIVAVATMNHKISPEEYKNFFLAKINNEQSRIVEKEMRKRLLTVMSDPFAVKDGNGEVTKRSSFYIDIETDLSAEQKAKALDKTLEVKTVHEGIGIRTRK